jgi:hypothetical protein
MAKDKVPTLVRTIHGKDLAFFENAKIRYKYDGKPVPGVTTILNRISKPFLYKWYADTAADHFLESVKSGRTDFEEIHKESAAAPNAKKVRAGGIGSNVHFYAECYFKNQPLPTLETDEAKKAVEAFHSWLEANHVEVQVSEVPVFSKEFYYAGTCDFVAKINGELCVGDIKTGSGIYDEARFQTAAYQQALQEETGGKYEARWIIRFDKNTGAFQEMSCRAFDLDFTGFSAALSLHKILKIIEAEKQWKRRN